MLTLALPATAHTRSELDAWVEAWSEQADQGLSSALLIELADMSDRHPWYFDPQPSYSTSSTSSSTSRSLEPNVEQWRALVGHYFNPEDVNTVLCIMGFESGGDPHADNPNSTARGLMQELKGWADHYGFTYEELYSPEVNLWIARQLRDSSNGWNHWNPYRLRGLCR